MAVYDPRGGGNVHIDKVLTNISMGYTNEDFVGEALFPSVGVDKQSDIYYEFGREGWSPEIDAGTDNTLRAPGTPATEVPGMTVATNPYFAKERALKIPVTDEEQQNADTPLRPRRDGTQLVTDKLLIGKELQIKTIATTAANYVSGHSTTLSGTSQWSDYTNGVSDPKDDVKTARDTIHSKIFRRMNLGIFPYEVMSQLEDHPNIIERIKYSERGILTQDIISAVLGLGNILVPGAGVNSANAGAAESIGYIWGKDVVLAYVPARAGMKIPAYGYEFSWNFGGASGPRRQVTRWRDEDRVSDLVRVRHRYDLKLIAVDSSGDSLAGYVIKAAVA